MAGHKGWRVPSSPCIGQVTKHRPLPPGAAACTFSKPGPLVPADLREPRSHPSQVSGGLAHSRGGWWADCEGQREDDLAAQQHLRLLLAPPCPENP